MKERDNRLRIFAINDAREPHIASDLLKIVDMPDGEGGKRKHMKHWLQHVHLLGSQSPITFDLLFIDIRFQSPHEVYAPKYGIDKHNPMGLLHALTFASRQDPSRAPLVWGYHSAEPDAVSKDPIAIIAFSLLAALEQRGAAGDILVGKSTWKWDDFSINNHPEYAVQHFSDAILNLPEGDDEIWQDMVRRYRNKLLHHVKNGRAFLEYEDIDSAYRLACKNTEGDRVNLAKLSLRFKGPSKSPWAKHILLQSLFADQLIYRQPEWPAEKVNCLREYLFSLKSMSVSKPPEYWRERVEAVLKGPGDSRLTGIQPTRDKIPIGVMAILCWWLTAKSKHEVNIKIDQLLTDLGYGGTPRSGASSQPLTRCVKSLGHDTLGAFVGFLGNTDTLLETPYYEFGRYWWSERLGCRIDRAPKCIQ